MTQSTLPIESDICLLLEGTYPYIMGGVSGWTHALISAIPDLSFSAVSVRENDNKKEYVYDLPHNVNAVHDIGLDWSFPGRSATRRDADVLARIYENIRATIQDGNANAFLELTEIVRKSKLSLNAILHSRTAWPLTIKLYSRLFPNMPLNQFVWTWRSLATGVLVSAVAEVPDSRLYHSISTGYGGLIAARKAVQSGRPFIITEHGIYTNERRIELYVADWLFDSGRSGFDTTIGFTEIRDLWMAAFSSFSRIAYECADRITTLYEGNQVFQIDDGAQPAKLQIIPNGVDVERLGATMDTPKPSSPLTIALIGRVVPIKDIRMFVSACSVLLNSVPDAEILILGPTDEDPEYAAECLNLVQELGLENKIQFCGRVNILEYLPRIHLLALTSLSEAMPLVLLEGGAAGIPSVATDVGSCRQLLEGFDGDSVKGVGGRIVKCGDAQSAGAAMAEILLDDALRKSMGAVMRERVMKTYNKETIDQTYIDLYNQWLAESDQRASEKTQRLELEREETRVS